MIKFYHYIFSFNLSREIRDVSQGFVHYSHKIYNNFNLSSQDREREREREGGEREREGYKKF